MLPVLVFFLINWNWFALYDVTSNIWVNDCLYYQILHFKKTSMKIFWNDWRVWQLHSQDKMTKYNRCSWQCVMSELSAIAYFLSEYGFWNIFFPEKVWLLDIYLCDLLTHAPRKLQLEHMQCFTHRCGT